MHLPCSLSDLWGTYPLVNMMHAPLVAVWVYIGSVRNSCKAPMVWRISQEPVQACDWPVLSLPCTPVSKKKIPSEPSLFWACTRGVGGGRWQRGFALALGSWGISQGHVRPMQTSYQAACTTPRWHGVPLGIILNHAVVSGRLWALIEALLPLSLQTPWTS